MNEWSLLIFTYMMNAAVGLCVVSGVFAMHFSHRLPTDSFKRFMMLTILLSAVLRVWDLLHQLLTSACHSMRRMPLITYSVLGLAVK